MLVPDTWNSRPHVEGHQRHSGWMAAVWQQPIETHRQRWLLHGQQLMTYEGISCMPPFRRSLADSIASTFLLEKELPLPNLKGNASDSLSSLLLWTVAPPTSFCGTGACRSGPPLLLGSG